MREKLLARGIRQGACLEWSGPVDSSGTPIYKAQIEPGKWRSRPVRRVIIEDIDPSRLASFKCGNTLCIEPKHLVALTRKRLQLRTAKITQYATNEIRRQKLSKARRERGTALNMEKVREMRALGMTSRQAAAKYGVWPSTASDALSGRTWKEHNFFSGLIAANTNWSQRA